MFDFHERRKIKAMVFSWPVILLVLVASALLTSSVYERFLKEREVAHRRAERTAELTELTERSNALEAQVRYLESERGIEEAIRDRYDAAKEGERVVIITGDPEDSFGRTEQEGREETKTLPSWIFFWR